MTLYSLGQALCPEIKEAVKVGLEEDSTPCCAEASLDSTVDQSCVSPLAFPSLGWSLSRLLALLAFSLPVGLRNCYTDAEAPCPSPKCLEHLS